MIDSLYYSSRGDVKTLLGLQNKLGKALGLFKSFVMNNKAFSNLVLWTDFFVLYLEQC